MINKQAPNDLNERTFKFALRIIKLLQYLPNNKYNEILGKQLLRSSTSIGANYREANESLTKKDFIHCAVICKKEAKETKFWLDLLFETNPSLQNRMLKLQEETIELIKIFSTMVKNAQEKLELGA